MLLFFLLTVLCCVFHPFLLYQLGLFSAFELQLLPFILLLHFFSLHTIIQLRTATIRFTYLEKNFPVSCFSL